MTQRATVLVVDDNVEVAEMTCAVLESAGLQAVYRTSVADAMNYIARNAEATMGILTDIYLETPMSGIELAVYIAAEWPEKVLCVTSGIAGERPRRLPPRAVFLPKPWSTPELLSCFIPTAPSSA